MIVDCFYIIIIIIIIIISTITRGIYNYMPETNHVSMLCSYNLRYM